MEQKNQKQQKKQFQNQRYLSVKSQNGLCRYSFFIPKQTATRLHSLIALSNKSRSDYLNSIIDKTIEDFLKITKSEFEQIELQQISEQLSEPEQTENKMGDYNNENQN